MKNVLIESTKEALRLVVLAVIPVFIAGIDSTTGAISINWSMVITVAAITGLRFVDSFLHETGKAKDDPTLKKGLTQF